MTLNVQLARNGEALLKHDGMIFRDPMALTRMSRKAAVKISGNLPSPTSVDDDEQDDDEQDDDEQDDDEAPVPG